jgi:hypothetical protein
MGIQNLLKFQFIIYLIKKELLHCQIESMKGPTVWDADTHTMNAR